LSQWTTAQLADLAAAANLMANQLVLFCVCLLAVLTILGVTVVVLLAANHYWMVGTKAVDLMTALNTPAQPPTLRHSIAQLPQGTARRVPLDDEKEVLVAHKQCQKRGKVQLVRLDCVGDVMEKHKGPAEAVAAVHALTHPAQVMDTYTAAQAPLVVDAAADVVQTAAAAAATATITMDTTAPSIQERLPVHLPTDPYTSQQLTSRYGLSTLEGGVPQQLQSQLDAMGQWACSDIQLNRPPSMHALALTTWEGVEKEVGRFLGFCVVHAGVQEPQLHHALNGWLVVRCIAFMRARGVQPQQLYDLVGNVGRVVTYLHATQQLQGIPAPLVAGYHHWLSNLGIQLFRLPAPPKPSKEALEQQGRWLKPNMLLVCMCRLYNEAAALVQQQAEPDDEPVVSTAVQVMHTIMCCFLFGFVPPLRPSIVVSLQLPSWEGGCTMQGCKIQDCKGNRLERVQGSTDLRLVAPHHKNSNRAKAQEISYLLPHEMTSMLEHHIRSGLPVVQSVGRRHRRQQQQLGGVFITQGGGPVHPNNMSLIWKKTVMPAGVSLPPRDAWHVHVTGFRAAAAARAAAGPADFEEGGTYGMGNSLDMWNKVYDRDYKDRQVQSTIEHLRQWRQQVMSETREEEGPQPAVLAAAAAAAAAAGAAAATPESPGRRRSKRSRPAVRVPVTPTVSALAADSSSSSSEDYDSDNPDTYKEWIEIMSDSE